MIIIELVIIDAGYKGWLKNGKPHRDNQRPAIYLKDRKLWFENGGFLKKE